MEEPPKEENFEERLAKARALDDERLAREQVVREKALNGQPLSQQEKEILEYINGPSSGIAQHKSGPRLDPLPSARFSKIDRMRSVDALPTDAVDDPRLAKSARLGRSEEESRAILDRLRSVDKLPTDAVDGLRVSKKIEGNESLRDVNDINSEE